MSNNLILTAGSGPSASSWPHWPTWTKLLPMLYNCDVVDAGAPAAGNKYLYRSILTRSEGVQPNLVLVQWNFGKFDIFVEPQNFVNEIINGTGIRNFILDIHTGKTIKESGYWCSSVDNTVPWKKYYNENIKSYTGTSLDDLEAMLSLQNFCSKKNFNYKFFTHDDVDHDFLSTNKHTRHFYNEIDWNLQVFDSIRTMYQNHESFKHSTSGLSREFHWVPNADFQYWFTNTKLFDLLKSVGVTSKNINKDVIKNYCHKKTLEFYEKVSSTKQ